MKTCPPGKGLILDENLECVCPPGHVIDSTGKCIPCRFDLGFVIENGRCVCDRTKGLVLDPTGVKCVCPPDYIFDDNGICVERTFSSTSLLLHATSLPLIFVFTGPECVRDQDCTTFQRCCANQTCCDPCIPNPCGANAYSTPINHQCQCTCIEGYQGDPYVGCGEFKTSISIEPKPILTFIIVRTVPIPPPPIVPKPFDRPEIIVNCLADGVQVDVVIADPDFHGIMYVKGHSDDPECRLAVEKGQTRRAIDFNVKFGTCGLFHYQGVASFILVVQKHPKLMTFTAQAYRIKCIYATGPYDFQESFNVSTLTTSGTIANTGPPPTCTMRICNSNGADISEAEIGDKLMLKVEVTPGEIYGGFARNCIAKTVDEQNDETTYTVTDDNGCATDPEIFRDWQYDRERGYLTAIFDAFKFPDSSTIKFKCNIRVCFGQCQPQNCANVNAFGRKKRETEHEVDGLVYTGQLREEILVQSNAILTIDRKAERIRQERVDRGLSGDEEVKKAKKQR